MSERSHRTFTSRRNDHCWLKFRPAPLTVVAKVILSASLLVWVNEWREDVLHPLGRTEREEGARYLICIDDDACSAASTDR